MDDAGVIFTLTWSVKLLKIKIEKLNDALITLMPEEKTEEKG